MGRRLYVANIGVSTSDSQLRQLFTPCGAVETITIPTSAETGQPTGFAFVDMRTYSDAMNAIAELDQVEIAGRRLTVSEAHPAVTGEEGGGRPNESRFVTAYAV